MNNQAWEEIESIYHHLRVNPQTVKQFQRLRAAQSSHTRAEGNLDHYCSFFLPYDKQTGKIYLGDHIKAGGWIPPGGHIEAGETPSDTAIRETKEEVKVEIDKSQLEPFDLSIAIVNRPKAGCMTHYDVWHLAHIPVQLFDFDRGEYHDAAWFTLAQGIAKMSKHPTFAAIVAKLA